MDENDKDNKKFYNRIHYGATFQMEEEFEEFLDTYQELDDDEDE